MLYSFYLKLCSFIKHCLIRKTSHPYRHMDNYKHDMLYPYHFIFIKIKQHDIVNNNKKSSTQDNEIEKSSLFSLIYQKQNQLITK